MILVGQYDSPFVRRVAVALNLQGRRFERRVLSTFADFDRMLEENPLGKVPVLVLDGGDRLYDSRAILEWLDRTAPEGRALSPPGPGAFERMLRIEAVALGLAEKVYERGIEVARKAAQARDPAWIARLERQIGSAQDWLEREIDLDAPPDRAGLTVAITSTFLAEKLPRLGDASRRPRLEAQRLACEALPAFAAAGYSAAEAAATGWRPEG